MNDTARSLLDAPHPAVLSTLNPEGSPQSSVVWVSRDGGELLISTEQGRRKERNILRDPRVGRPHHPDQDPRQRHQDRLDTVRRVMGRAMSGSPRP
ncbi:pyridoxamine 5'-phosphate oxidase family protein [Streptomyces sp. NPDC004284]|uniref:pyridoxamine 5'-phosphate oxidase family protein n=1 Tax=Streptomyces sp. NPDC004284 TaxID=3364695 RepID=UPI0036ADE52C